MSSFIFPDLIIGAAAQPGRAKQLAYEVTDTVSGKAEFISFIYFSEFLKLYDVAVCGP